MTDEPLAFHGTWTVENGQPFYVDPETQAHFHPSTIRGFDEDTQREAWLSLGDLIGEAAGTTPAVTPERHVGLIGFAQSGKDTAAEGLVAHGWQRLAFADVLRSMAYQIDPLVTSEVGDTIRLSAVVDLVGWERAKANPEVRRFLQRLGTEGIRNHLPSGTLLEATMQKATRPSVFTDVRFPNEADAILAADGILIRITREGIGALNDHPSEHSLDTYTASATVLNNGTVEDLHRAVLILATDG